MTRIGVLTGLAREAAVLHRADAAGTRFQVGLGAMDPGRCRAEARRLAAAGPDLLVSFGLAGGLVAHRRPGELVLPRAVVTPEGDRWTVDAAWRDALAAHLRAACDEPVTASVDAPVTTPSAKRDLAARTGAPIVDMESAVLARAAAEHGLPMIVVRAVCDPVGRTVPAVMRTLTDGAGRLRVSRLPALGLHLPTVLGLARDSGRAMRSLRPAAGALAQLDTARGRPATS